jgi:2-C-methyl-D-erythritol 4-phosphate cytidylyltransferase
MSDAAVIIVAAGKSSRFNDKNYKKPFVSIRSRALWLHSVDRFLSREDVKQVIVVIADEDQTEFHQRFGGETAVLGLDVVVGGDTRADSVLNGLRAVRHELEYVAVHDAARPCIAETWLDELFVKARQTGAAILATPVVSTVKRVSSGQVAETVPRDGLWESQTPQMFQKHKLLQAYEEVDDYTLATDESQLMEWTGQQVSIVEASALNRKVTTQADLQFVEMALDLLPKPKLDGPARPFEDGDIWR